MFTSILNLLRLKHYKKARLLKTLSGLQFYLTLLLIILPCLSDLIVRSLLNFYSIDVNLLDATVFHSFLMLFNIFAWLIAILSAINLFKEFYLSKSNIVGFEFKKELIKQLITFLMDHYEWRGTCRASLFIPYKNKLKIYERISYGIGDSDFEEGKAFFRKGQGIPGKAWDTASSGTKVDEILNSIQIGNIPVAILKDEKATRRFFKENFGITDNDIYESLSSDKSKIQSYMAVGILGRYQKLIAVLSIDSQDPEKFTDFETLKSKRDGKLTQKLTIVGEGDPGQGIFPRDVMTQLCKLLPDSRKKIEEASGWDEQKAAAKEVAFMALAARSIETRTHAPSFIYPLQWVLNQIKEIFTMDI